MRNFSIILFILFTLSLLWFSSKTIVAAGDRFGGNITNTNQTISGVWTFSGDNTFSGTSNFSGNVKAAALISDTYNFAADGQGNDDYELTIPEITALTTGLIVTFTATTANTGGATLEISSVGDLDAILKLHDQALVTGDIEAGQAIVCLFDGTNWQMISQLAQ